MPWLQPLAVGVARAARGRKITCRERRIEVAGCTNGAWNAPRKLEIGLTMFNMVQQIPLMAAVQTTAWEVGRCCGNHRAMDAAGCSSTTDASALAQ